MAAHWAYRVARSALTVITQFAPVSTMVRAGERTVRKASRGLGDLGQCASSSAGHDGPPEVPPAASGMASRIKRVSAPVPPATGTSRMR